MSPTALVALVAFLFPLAYSPGPGNAFFAAIGASRGLRAAAPALVGYHVVTFLVTALLGLGVGVTLLDDPVVARSLALLGSLYVLWLAVGFIRAAHGRAAPGGEASPPRERAIGFWAGANVLLLNPKAYYIIAVMFAQFLPGSAEGRVPAVLVLTVVFTLNNLVAFVGWTLGGRLLTAAFRDERSRRWIDYVFGAMLLAVAVWLAAPLLA